MDEHLAHLLDLRIRARGDREAVALIDGCLAIAARARTADPAALRSLAAEVDAIGDELARRYGAPRTAVLQ